MIGLVGDGETTAALAEVLGDAGLAFEAGSAARVLGTDPDVVVAAGEPAIVDLVDADVSVPVLPVGLGRGLPSVPPTNVSDVVDRLRSGTYGTAEHHLLGVEVDGDPAGTAVFDAMLVRSEPGRISEYRVAAGELRSRFRADGVVVATPAGSHGYAHAAGGPRLGLDTGAVAVVPVAAFGLGAPNWVLDPGDGLEVRVERDEGDVSLLVDGRERRTEADRFTVRLAVGGTLRAVVPPSNRGPGQPPGDRGPIEPPDR